MRVIYEDERRSSAEQNLFSVYSYSNAFPSEMRVSLQKAIQPVVIFNVPHINRASNMSAVSEQSGENDWCPIV